MKKIKLSFAIVTFNNEAIIRKTVESIVDNIPSNYDYTLYVVDNSSTDNTLQIVRKIKGNIQIIESENFGFGYGHNRVLPILDSRYHFVVNPDITIENQSEIKTMVEYLEQNNEVGLLSPLILNEDLTIQHLCKKHPTVFDMFIRRISPNLLKNRQNAYIRMETGYNSIFSLEYATGSFMVFKTSIFKQIGGFDEAFFMYLEDADITRRVNQISKSIFFPFAKVIHTWERSSHKSIKFTKITIQSMFIYFNKWGWKFI